MRKLGVYLVVDWGDIKYLVEIITENYEPIAEKDELDPKRMSVIDFAVA